MTKDLESKQTIASAMPRQLCSSELVAKLEAGYVLEYYGEFSFNRAAAQESGQFMGFYRRLAYTLEGYTFPQAHYSFGCWSACGTTDEKLLSLITNPEWWGCRDMKPREYGPDNKPAASPTT